MRRRPDLSGGVPIDAAEEPGLHRERDEARASGFAAGTRSRTSGTAAAGAP